MNLSPQKEVFKNCFVPLKRDVVDFSPKSSKRNKQRTELQKCVVFLDKDSIINTNVIRNKIRAQSMPSNRSSIIRNDRSSLPKTLDLPTLKCPSHQETPRCQFAPLIEIETPQREPALVSELKRAIDEKNLLTTKTKSKFMSDLTELEKDNEEENRKRYKNKALQEVVTSEQIYIKQLETIINFFQKPIREKALLSKQDLETIFGGLTAIFKLNRELLDMLVKELDNVGAAFLKIAPFFKLYSSYAYDFKHILDLIEKNEEHNEEFRKFIQNQESRPEVHAKLSALLITPIQRVPRYCLLLKQILQHTLPIEDDFETIKESLKAVEKSAKHIDTLVEQKENSNQLLQIQNALVDNKPTIIKPGRYLIREGRVLRILPSVVTQIHLVLMNDIILFCKIKRKNRNATKNSLKCETIYPLSNCTISEKNVSRNIYISCENESIQIYIEKEKDFRKWCMALKEACNNSVKNRQTLHKENSLRKPAHQNDFSRYNEVDISPFVPQRKRRFSEVLHDNDQPRADVLYEPDKNDDTPSKKLCTRSCVKDRRDSLFPLRRQFISSKRNASYTSNESENDIVKTSNDIFVFGNCTNVNRGFNFKITNFFSNITNSVRKFFGYRK